MEKIGQKYIDLLGVMRSFWEPEKSVEDEKNSGYEEWKIANVNNIDQAAITNLEKMIENQLKKKEKHKNDNNKNTIESIEKVEIPIKQRQQGEQHER